MQERSETTTGVHAALPSLDSMKMNTKSQNSNNSNNNNNYNSNINNNNNKNNNEFDKIDNKII